jgi:hypothetical protein
MQVCDVRQESKSAYFMTPQNTEYAVGWFTLSLINAGLAQSKGRGRLTWWLASLFLGPIATFLIVATDEKTDRK